ncbi:DNA glycosylase [Cystobasidium minutum MCA 4210]|uniref:DNA glycosylase n=1 Tax=Cystobasidium minutum MCA 4210 TaxID=1397322 RepID=UPI0034CF4D82|eukprot:jgi/Rhomi1/188700/estExt_fgenesh1_pg.C_3_t10091
MARDNHPMQQEILRVNASKIRDHASKYHDVLSKYDILKDINEPLLAWYGSRGSLPWRTDLSDEDLQALSAKEKAQRAYEVWVSEIMLQQTQVATVIPYFERWIAAFPTVKKLSQASIDEVNTLWKGLGYYSRASRLLKGAQTVMEDYNGALPSDPEELVKKIEGIGPYTAGAIASIAYGVSTPTVDGNIQRVICRYLAIYADMKKKPVLDYIWKRAEELVPKKRAGHWNQALMDLGATICTPKNPKCSECPLNRSCLGFAETRYIPWSTREADIEDLASPSKADKRASKACSLCLPLDPPSLKREVTLFPLKVVKKKSRDEDIAVCVTRWKGAEETKVLLIKRPEKGLLAGLDEFPNVIMPDGESDIESRFEASLDLLQEVLSISDASIEEMKESPQARRESGSIKHIYSHINAMFHCRLLDIPAADDKAPRIRSEWKSRARWVDELEVDNANISTGHVKVWKLVGNEGSALAVKKNGKGGAPASKRKVVEKKEEKGQMKLSFTKSVSVSSVKHKEEVTVVEKEVESVAVQMETTENRRVHDKATSSSAAAATTPRKKRRIDISSDEDE